MAGTWAQNMTSGRLVAVRQVPERLGVKQGRGFFRDVESCLNVDRPRVVLDCSKVKQLDSAGIQVLLRCLEEAMKRNGDVKLAAIPPGAAAILSLTRADRLFEAFDSTADAVNSFHRLRIKPFPADREYEYATVGSEAPPNGYEDSQSDSRDRRPVSQITVSQIATRTSGSWLRRQIAGFLLLLLIAPLAAAAPSPQQEANSNQQSAGASSVQSPYRDSDSGANTITEPPQPQAQSEAQSDALPNSPGTIRAQDRMSSDQQPSPALQTGAQDPLGTAAAPSAKTTGVAASRPAGAAIAPAKQKRARSILIKVAAIVGAGAAVGIVVALSSASPSRAPGSR
jgi:anti-anti-sigma factor